ncbi:MAG: hypothetical protein F2842_11860 [Actinobacteria bacterium]|nr:hypothetical protein [Actinomycetota bacterium]
MTTITIRTLSLSALVVGALGAGLIAAPVANAYPPGTFLDVAASPSTVKQDTYFTLYATHAKPGCYVTFTANTRYFHGGRKKADRNGNASIRAEFEKYGSFTVRATTTSGSCGGESDTTPVTVTKAPRHRH